MSPSRLRALLWRFGLSERATVSDLRAAFLQRAHKLHPDRTQTQDTTAFVDLKEDYDEAVRLLRASPYFVHRRPTSEERTVTRGLALPPLPLVLFCAVGFLAFVGLKCARIPSYRQQTRPVLEHPKVSQDREVVVPRRTRSSYYLERKTIRY
uniref:J domain-containing protein n=1 Tax=Noctiluca scintillans TaxID=2966 RepID=A0A7S1A974_NOCSC|mmetsp:Transcript_36935/g.98405  ORF Transcript_36935/g.98405 Transcript_36935/m.98405 type:complete len:152 (+) Transcript_36935:43-498(+)